MKLFSAIILICEFALSPVARGASTNGSPVAPQGPKIVWSTPTNAWPNKVWSYKVIPQEFPEAVISNLLAVGSLTNGQTKAPKYLLEKDKKAVFFQNVTGKATERHLAVCPTLGWIEYHDDAAKSSSQLKPIVNVPNQEATTQLGLKYLQLLGIDIAQIAVKPGSCDFDLHWMRETIGYTDQKTKEETTLTNMFGIIFARRVDGIKVHGFGGVDISFGNNAQVSDLRVCWRNLKPHQLHNCPSLEQINNWLRQGQIPIHPAGSKNRYPVEELRTLTITKVTPLYYGKDYDKPMDFVFPYAHFEGAVENERATNTVWFQSPLTLEKENWQVIQ